MDKDATYPFKSGDSIVYDNERDDLEVVRHTSETGKTSPLDFLAQASAFQEPAAFSKWITTSTEGREKITVVPGPAGPSLRLHKGNGRLPPVDLSKPFAKKCRNRECNNLSGQVGKPRSIYCSKRCQSREQNLRQGRIKNARSPVPTIPNTPPTQIVHHTQQPQHHNPNNHIANHNITNHINAAAQQLNGMSRSPTSSPVPPPLGSASPSPSPLSMTPPPSSPISFSSTSPCPSPTVGLSAPSPLMMAPTHSTSAIHTMTPSPLTMRLGMTPSPIPLSPSPASMLSNSFSPIPMSSSIPSSSGIFLPKPTQGAQVFSMVPPSGIAKPTPVPASMSPSSSFSAPIPVTAKKPSASNGSNSNSNSPTPSGSNNGNNTTSNTNDLENLTLAPILSS